MGTAQARKRRTEASTGRRGAGPIPSSAMRPRLPIRSLVAVLAIGVILAACTGDGSPSSSFPAVLDPGETTSLTPASPSDPALVAAAQDKIKHIVFVIKENRTFDNYFGQFPGADGATQGTKCDGSVVPL